MLCEFKAESDGKTKGSWLLGMKMSILQRGSRAKQCFVFTQDKKLWSNSRKTFV